jgi:hypothetical protein
MPWRVSPRQSIATVFHLTDLSSMVDLCTRVTVPLVDVHSGESGRCLSWHWIAAGVQPVRPDQHNRNPSPPRWQCCLRTERECNCAMRQADPGRSVARDGCRPWLNPPRQHFTDKPRDHQDGLRSPKGDLAPVIYLVAHTVKPCAM